MPVTQIASSTQTTGKNQDRDENSPSEPITTIAPAGDQATTDLQKPRNRETSVPFQVTTAMPSQRSTRPPRKSKADDRPRTSPGNRPNRAGTTASISRGVPLYFLSHT